MLVWLASYPRSGNHLLRTILHRCFDLGSYEIYQKGDRPVDPKWSAIIGALRFGDDGPEEFVARARSAPELFLVKLADPVPDTDKCIYIVRDGRAALASYERYLADFAGKPRALADLIAGKQWPGKWQDHVKRFLSRDSKNTLILRYEELASGRPPLERIGTFVGVAPIRPFDVGFSQLHALSPQLFPTGNNRVGIETIERDHGRAFWRSCGDIMRTLGYETEAADRPEARKIFFLHLPKCAGTSLWLALRKLTGKEHVFQIWSEERRQQFASLKAAQRNAYRVVGGHYSLDFYRESLDLSQYFCITTFRDPMQRVLSEYNHARRDAKHSEHETIARLSLKEFIQRNSNPITRLICGRPDARAAIATIREVFDRWAFVEDLDELVADLCHVTGRPARVSPRLNVGPPLCGVAEPDQELRSLIQDHHGADLELYRLLSEVRAAEVASPLLAAASPVSISASPPVFHVVTPAFNAARYLDETIDSVVGQSGDFSIRYHIQDGGSGDGTLEIARRWQDRVEARDFPLNCRNVKLTVELRPDGGMYDAIAAGFRSLAPASDDLMTWINADDRLAPGAMRIVSEAFRDLSDVELVGGRAALIDAQGRAFSAGPLAACPRKCVAAGLHDGRWLPFIMQEGSFWRAGLWNRTGGVDTRFRLAGDWDLWRRFAAETEYVRLDAVLGYHRRHVGQLTEDLTAYFREVDQALAEGTSNHETTRQQYLRWWAGSPDSSGETFPAHVARRTDAGRWSRLVWPGPVPLNRSVSPLDGDWAVVSGFDSPEGPLPELGINTQFYWTIAQPATLDLFSSLSGRRTISLKLSSMVRRQKVEVRLNGGPPVQHTFRRRFPKAETIAIEHDFTPGACRLEISVDRWVETAEGRKLGVIVNAVQFEVDQTPGRRFAFRRLGSILPFKASERAS